MRHFICLIIVLHVAVVGHAEDFLAEDELSFDSDFQAEELTWLDQTRFTVEQDFSQENKLQLLRSHLRFEYESAPWDGTYVKVDNKLSYFWHKDRQADQRGTDYLFNKLNEAWFQISHQDCFAKVGRQTLLWGSVEGTFAVDVLAPFDYTEPLLTDFTTIRLAQDLVNLECFYETQQLQVFLQPRARLDRFEHRQKGPLKHAESHLDEEWGGRFIKSWEGVDLHLMYARLYGNTPVFPTLEASRYDFYGVTLVQALGRLLIEADIAYKPKQIEAFSGLEDDQFEVALGFEYTTSSNHQWNAGVWQFDTQPSIPTDGFKKAQAWTLGWSKTYLNDDLTMSLLGSLVSEPEQSSLTLQSQYKWDDFWTLSAALGYADLSIDAPNLVEGWLLNLNAKWQY